MHLLNNLSNSWTHTRTHTQTHTRTHKLTQRSILGSDENHYTNFAVPVFISFSPAVIWDKEMDTWQERLPPENEINNNPVPSNCASTKSSFPDGNLNILHTHIHKIYKKKSVDRLEEVNKLIANTTTEQEPKFCRSSLTLYNGLQTSEAHLKMFLFCICFRFWWNGMKLTCFILVWLRIFKRKFFNGNLILRATWYTHVQNFQAWKTSTLRKNNKIRCL